MRHIRIAIALAIGVMLVVGACGRGSSAAPSSLPVGQTTLSLSHDGLDRSYIAYVPASLDRSRPAPLVFVFHGGTGNAESAIRMSDMNAVADEHGFVAVYPNGTGPLATDKLLTWNGGNCCGYAQEHRVDDVGFARAIVSDLESRLDVDAGRVYASGMSNGALLSQRLGCEAADVFAAIAPVAGTMNSAPCQPSRPVSVIEFHGTADTHIPYEGGYGPASLVHVDFASVATSVSYWVSADGCSPQPSSTQTGAVRHDTWTGCSGSTAVELYTIEGGGHAWPGGARGTAGADQPTGAISASELIWAFFAAHPRA